MLKITIVCKKVTGHFYLFLGGPYYILCNDPDQNEYLYIDDHNLLVKTSEKNKKSKFYLQRCETNDRYFSISLHKEECARQCVNRRRFFRFTFNVDTRNATKYAFCTGTNSQEPFNLQSLEKDLKSQPGLFIKLANCSQRRKYLGVSSRNIKLRSIDHRMYFRFEKASL